MGKPLTKTIDRWNFNPRNVTNQSRRKKAPATNPRHESAEAPVYDTVAESSVYSVPNKRRQPREEIQYAEVHVLQRRSSAREGTLPRSSGTEYATIDFQPRRAAPSRSKSVNSGSSKKTADLSISPGDLRRPIPKPRLKMMPPHQQEHLQSALR